MHTTFFEIGGLVIESYVVSGGVEQRPPQNIIYEKGKQLGVPKPLIKTASKELEEASGIDIIKLGSAGGRGRRAGWALRTAAALALIDGPVPIGDALAAGLLVVYAGYEVTRTAYEVKEGFGY